MKKAIFPGSFDPITNGHIDIIQRASGLFDRVGVVMLRNSSKQSMFSYEERIAFITQAVAGLDNVDVFVYDGLCVNAAKEYGACAMIRGVRSVKDYEYEMEIASINKAIDPTIETLLLYTNPMLQMVSSSSVKELVTYGVDVCKYVSKEVEQALIEKINHKE